MRALRLLATVLAFPLLASCADAASHDSPPQASEPKQPAPVTAPVSCPADLSMGGRPDRPVGGQVPAEAKIAWVLRCRTEVKPVAGKGTWQMLIAERANGNPVALRAALAKASEPRTTLACPAIAMVVPYFVLVDESGGGYLPFLPTDSCQKPQGEAMAAVQALRFTISSSTPIRQIEPEPAQHSGCSQRWKDLINISAGSARSGLAVPWPSPPKQITACVYAAATGTDGGKFIRTRLLDAAQTQLLIGSLRSAAAAEPCSKAHTEFAVLIAAVPAGEAWYAEVDGCQRVLRPNNTLGQLPAAALDSLRS